MVRGVVQLASNRLVPLFDSTRSALLLLLAAHFTVSCVTKISQIINAGSEVLAARIIALGTSLPELTVSVQSAR